MIKYINGYLEYFNPLLLILGFILIMPDVIKQKFSLPKSSIIYIVFISLSLFMNFNILTAKQYLYEILYIGIIFYFAKNYLEEKEIKNIIKLVSVFCLICIIMIYFIHVVFPNQTIDNILFTNPNGGAALALLCIVFVLQSKCYFKLLLLLSYLSYIYFSDSRAAMIIFFVLILYKLISTMKSNVSKAIKKIILISFIILSSIIGLYFYPVVINNTYSNIDNSAFSIERKIGYISSERYYLWKYGFITVKEKNLFFGIGSNIGEQTINNYNEVFLNVLSPKQKDMMSRNNLHNGYMQILVTHGLLSLLIFLRILFDYNKKLNNTFVRGKEFLLFYLLINFFENVFVLSNSVLVLIFWVIYGYLFENRTMSIEHDSYAMKTNLRKTFLFYS